jgi:hypothetical protein
MPDIGRDAKHLTPWLPSVLSTGALIVVDRARALGPGLASLVDYHASNIGDPWPTVVAARALLERPRAPLYASFSLAGSSFIYPPVAALLMLPFARMSHEEAHLALSVLTRLAYLGCAALTYALARRVGKVRGAACAAVLALGFYPLLVAVQLNQSTLLVAVCVGGALLAAQKDRQALAGVLIGATAALKPQMALIVPLMVWHSRRLVWGGLASMGAAGLASIAAGGLADHVDYVTRVLPRLSTGYAFHPNQCWTGAILRAAGEPFVDFALPTPSTAEKVVALAASAATLLGAAVVLRTAARRRGHTSPDVLVCAIGLAWLAVTLASPISWVHHFTPCMFLYAFVAATYGSWTRRARSLALASFPLIAAYIEVRAWTGPIGRLATNTVLGGALLLAAAFALALLGDLRATARRA